MHHYRVQECTRVRNYTTLGFEDAPAETVRFDNATRVHATYIRVKAELFMVIIIFSFFFFLLLLLFFFFFLNIFQVQILQTSAEFGMQNEVYMTKTRRCFRF